jgi:1-acyl-sn-glycerol-3-phosphate acyltransferase
MTPVYGLAECSVGLAFTPPGTPWQMDTLDREHFSRSGEAVPAREDDPAPLKVVACGHAIPDHEMRVVDAAGLELPDRSEGALQFRGPSATSGYYRNPEATRELFDGEWLNTGDRAYLDHGMLYLTGREKDIIIRGGRNISPYELEEAVGDVPGVRRGCVAVFGSLDAASGTERIVVLAETRQADASTKEDVKRRINDLALNLIGLPVDDIVLAPPHTVPKTSSGKIRRVAARDYYERGPQAVRPHAVWLQFIRLAAAGVAPQLLSGFGCLFVERFDVQRSAEHADELVDAAKRGRSLAVFPEGTLQRRPGLMPFRTGAFQVAVQAGVPVVPVALRGVRSVLRDGTWYARRHPMAVTFGAPIAPEGDDWNAAVRLRDRVRAEVLKHCGEPDTEA